MLFQYIVDWKKELCDNGLMEGGSGAKEPDVEPWSAKLGEWLAVVRMGGAPPSLPPLLPVEHEQQLSGLFASLKLTGLDPRQVLVVCEAGSKLYNLSLPTSDSDYIIIFQHSTTAILSSLDPLKVLVKFLLPILLQFFHSCP